MIRTECGHRAKKNGFQKKTGRQKYCCRGCNTHFQDCYSNNAYKPLTNRRVAMLVKEGMGINNISP